MQEQEVLAALHDELGEAVAKAADHVGSVEILREIARLAGVFISDCSDNLTHALAACSLMHREMQSTMFACMDEEGDDDDCTHGPRAE